MEKSVDCILLDDQNHELETKIRRNGGLFYLANSNKFKTMTDILKDICGQCHQPCETDSRKTIYEGKLTPILEKYSGTSSTREFVKNTLASI